VSVHLNHTIVWCRDKQTSASFLTEVLGLPTAEPFGPFMVVELGNGVSLDFHEIDGTIASQHYAFLIGEDDFDRIYRRICDRDLAYWADPGQRRRGEINGNDGGRGVYFNDPDGHLLEIITRPYGGGQSGTSAPPEPESAPPEAESTP
jgi:catechol 2,3-dioxygenase-like lactoylglutathione lyase family enzyme